MTYHCSKLSKSSKYLEVESKASIISVKTDKHASDCSKAVCWGVK